MQKKRNRGGVFSSVSGQILLLLCAMFAFSFVIAQANVVNADEFTDADFDGTNDAATANTGGGAASTSTTPVVSPVVGAGGAAAATATSGISTVTSSSSSLASGASTPLVHASGFQKSTPFLGKTLGSSPVPTGTNALILRQGGVAVGAIPEVTFSSGETYYGVKNVVTQPGGGASFEYGGYYDSVTGASSGAGRATFSSNELGSLNGDLASQGRSLNPAYKTKVFGVGPEVSGMWAHLATGVTWAVGVVGLIQLVGRIAGLDDKLTNSLSAAAGLGIIGGRLAYGAVSEGKFAFNTFAGKLGLSANSFGLIAGVGIAAAVFFLMYKKEEKRLVKFECLPWEAPLGGKKCEECNKDPARPCTEYRCKSLGQVCDLVNKGTKLEQCVYKSVNDARSPVITPWKDALSPGDLSYVTDTSVRPPAIGVKIVSRSGAGGCLPAYTPLKFGITTDKPSQCKIDFNATTLYTDMQYYIGESNYFAYNHTQQMRLPAPDTVTQGVSPILRNDGSMTMYIRCQDANGNYNVDAYAASFCVDKGPDTTPPIIEGFSIPSESFVQYKKDNVPLQVYTNEPADCKWSVQSKTFETMENTMTCASESVEINADLVYTCKGTVTGVKDRADNTYYFRCKDLAGNVNVASKELVLKGSQPLTILSAGPNGTIAGSTDVVKIDLGVTTTNGAEDGKATCAFAPSGQKDFVKMFETGAITHKQTLTLSSGDYNYSLRCIDAGGNLAETSTSFVVNVDKQSPKVTRAYRFNTEALRLVTDENAECVYSLTTCNFKFSEGVALIHSPISELNTHLAEWKDNAIYHVKCSDAYDNEPDPAACNIVVSASQLGGNETSG